MHLNSDICISKIIIESINSFLNILLEVLLFVNIVFKSGIHNTVVFLKPFLFSALNTLVSDPPV